MTAIAHEERFREPTIKRLGFEDGWWFFCPHFLNLGLPLILVDQCLVPDADHLGLKAFGTIRPDSPLPILALRVGLLGDGVKLYTSGREPHFLVGHWFRTLTLLSARNAPRLGVLIGDSYSVQLSLSALWSCRIGVTGDA